jgi:hypothetical protein
MKSVPLVTVVLCLLTVGNLYATFKLSTKLENIEGRAASPAATTVMPPTSPKLSPATVQPVISPLADSYDRSFALRQASQRLINQRLNQANGSAYDQARSMDSLLNIEPKNPALETKNLEWMQTALQSMQADTSIPTAKNVQTVCQGRRCLVSAEFGSLQVARNWASRYLLAGNGQNLSRARPIVTPTLDGGTQLKLYLF